MRPFLAFQQTSTAFLRDAALFLLARIGLQSTVTKMGFVWHDSAAGFFRSYSPPAYVYEKGAENGFGTSQLVSGGARVVSGQ